MQATAIRCTICGTLINVGKGRYVAFYDAEGLRVAIHRGCFSKAFRAWSEAGRKIEYA